MKIVNDNLLQKRINFFPHEGQQKILKEMKRFTIIAAGRRFGKSEICAYLALRESLATRRNIWVVSQTYNLSKKVLSYIIQWIGQSFPKSFTIQESPHPIIKSPTGSIIEGKSAENKEDLMGEELDLVIVDEASVLSKNVWDSYIYPTLSSRKGKAVIISTPKGQNWFYRMYLRKSTDPINYSSFHFESRDNPFFPSEEWGNAKNNLPSDIFDQEYRAIFLSDAASVFRKIDEAATGKFKEPEGNHFYVMGVDLGKYEDFTVITVIDRNTHEVIFFDRFHQIGYSLQRERIMETARKYNDALVVIDSTGVGDPISEDLANNEVSIIDFKYTSQSKNQLITKLSIFIEKGKIVFPDIEILIDELKSFGYNRTDRGNIIYSAPEGMHDDCVNSLALAVWELFDEKTNVEESPIFDFPTVEY